MKKLLGTCLAAAAIAHAVSVLLVLLTGKYLVKIVQVSLGLSIKIAFKKAIKLQLL